MSDTKDIFAKLHRRLAEELLARLENEGTPPSAAELNVIRQFLKDNGIDEVAKPGTPVYNLASRLPFVDEDLKKTS